MDQADAAALVGADQGPLAAQGPPAAAPDQPEVRLVVRLGMNIPVTLTLDDDGDNDDEDSDDEDDGGNSTDTANDTGYESDNSVVFLGEVIHLD